MKLITMLGALVLTLAAGAATLGAQSGYDLFQKALATERADGNLREAIQMYERVVEQFASDRTLVARALVRIADCHEKLGQRDATKVYERVVREFSDQAESVAVARTRLNALQAPRTEAAQTVRQLWAGAGVDPMGTPSADGRLLTYTDWDTGDLAIRDLVEGSSRRLTNTGGWERSGDFAEFSVLSPDARMVAYAWFTDKAGDPASRCACRYELRLMSLTGADAGKARVLIPPAPTLAWVRPAAWMPDGKTLVVVRASEMRDSELGLVSINDGTYKRLTTLAGVSTDRISASPDGQLLALDLPSADDPLSSDIVLLSPVTGERVAVLQNPANDFSPVFSASGSHLLFLSDRTGAGALWRVPIAKGKPAGVAEFVSSVSANSGILGTTRGGAVYYWSGGPTSNVFSVDTTASLTARGAPAVVIERFVNTNMVAVLSPDGEQLAYLSRRGAAQGSGRLALVVHTLATKRDREVPVTVPVYDGLSWYPDNRSILLSVRDQPSRTLVYYRVDTATGQAERVMQTQSAGRPSRQPQVTRDGRSIVYSDSAPDSVQGAGSRSLIRFDLETRTSTVLNTSAHRDEYFTAFAVSPDGMEVASLRFDGPDRNSILEVMPVAGGAARELFREKNLGGTRFSGLAWSPDKRYVVMVRNNQPSPAMGSAFWKVPVAGGPPEPTGITSAGQLRSISIAPQATRVIFTASAGGGTSIWAVENFLPKK